MQRLAVIFVFIGTGALAWGQATVMRDIRIWPQQDVTRAIIEFSADFEVSHGRLSNPERVFFDIPNSTMQLSQASGKRYYATSIEGRMVQKLRVAESDSGTTRLVFDLAGADSKFTVSELANPPRLVIEWRTAPGKTASPSSSGPARVSAAPAAPRTEAPKTVVPRITVQQMRDEAKRAAAGKPVDPPPASSPVTAQPPGTQVPAAQKTDGVRAVSVPANKANRSMTRTLGLKLTKIVIDPGHGGNDFGASSQSGKIHEKDLVLDVALRLGALLADELGAEVVYTRTDDTFVPLERRTAFANAARADLFVSIHANASRNRKVAGPETFFLNFSGPPDAMEVAARENATSSQHIFELDSLLKKIALNDKASESREFAAHVQTSLRELASSARIPNTRDRGVKHAPFVVLIGASMPSILTEIGFVSNSREETLMAKPSHRQKIAEALAKGISQYANTLSRFEVAAGDRSSGHNSR